MKKGYLHYRDKLFINMMSYVSLTFLLLVMTWGGIIYYDLRYRTVPDALVLCLLILGCLQYSLTYERFLCAGMLGLGGALFKRGAEKLLGRPALGWGDVKLAAALGIGMMPEQISFFLICAGLIGCLWGVFHKIIFRESLFPFAPSLILAFLLVTQFLY